MRDKYFDEDKAQREENTAKARKVGPYDYIMLEAKLQQKLRA